LFSSLPFSKGKRRRVENAEMKERMKVSVSQRSTFCLSPFFLLLSEIIAVEDREGRREHGIGKSDMKVVCEKEKDFWKVSIKHLRESWWPSSVAEF
jgi:hypothetical protein